MATKKQQEVTEQAVNKQWLAKGLILLAVLAVVVVAIMIGTNGATEKALSRQDAPLTELYVSSAEALPKKVKPGQKVQVPAMVTNHEGKNTEYDFRVTLTPKKNTQTAEATEYQRGSVTVANEATAKLPIEFSAPSTSGDYDVTVSLVGRDEVIHYTIGVE